MDALVAKEVMGYAVNFEESQTANGQSRRVWFIVTQNDQPRRQPGSGRSAIATYSTDMNAALRVARKIEAKGDALSLQYRNPLGEDPGALMWAASFQKAKGFAWAGTPALAICRAALLAIRNRRQAPTKNVNGTFFPLVERELARVMGPIAPIIVDDKLAGFGESKDSFPEDRVESFVKAVSEEIADDDEKARFLRAMAEFHCRRQREGKRPVAAQELRPKPQLF